MPTERHLHGGRAEKLALVTIAQVIAKKGGLLGCVPDPIQ